MMVRKNPLKIRKINQDFILASIKPEGKDLTNLFTKYGEMLDWDWLLGFSQKRKISGIFINSLNRLGITEQLPLQTRNILNLIQNQAKQRLNRVYTTLNQLSKVLTYEKIPFLVLKGSVFAEEVYGDPTVRPFHDVDLLIPEHLLRKAEDILISLGYTFYCPPALGFIPLRHTLKDELGAPFPEDITKQFYKRYHFHFPFVLPPEDERLPIDLHWHLFPPGILNIDSKSIWEFTREKAIGNLSIITLNVEATLLYLATWIAIRGPMSFELLQVCDFIRHLNVFKDRYNVHLLWQIADKWGAGNYLKFSLALTKKLFNCDTSPILSHTCKKDIVSNFSFATNKFTLMQPEKSTMFQKFKCCLLWDLTLLRLPRLVVRHGVRKLIRGIIEFGRKRKLIKNAFNRRARY